MTQEEQSQNLIIPPGLEVKQAIATPYFSIGHWPEENWWEVFGSPELNGLIDTALAQNPSLQNVEQRVSYAKAEADIAKAKLYPLLFFNASDNWQYLSKNGLYRAFNPDIPLSAKLVDLTLAFSYEFDFWSKYRNTFRAAQGRERAEEAAAAQVKLIVTTGLAQAFFALKTNLVKERLILELRAVRKNLYDLQCLLKKSALDSLLPVYLAEENLFETEKLVDAIEAGIATDKHLINILAGNGPDSPLEVGAQLPPLPSSLVIPETLSLDLLGRRPDLMSQIWRVEALAHEVGAARANYFPNINIAAFVGQESTIYHRILDSSSTTYGADPALSLPIYTAGAIQANIDTKHALFNAALYEYNDLVLKSSQEVADILVLAKSVFTQATQQKTIVNSAQNRFRLTQLRQQCGLDNALQFLAFQEEVIQKQLEEIDLIYGQYLTSVKLIKALGGGYSTDIVPIRKL